MINPNIKSIEVTHNNDGTNDVWVHTSNTMKHVKNVSDDCINKIQYIFMLWDVSAFAYKGSLSVQYLK